jgi:23S rRNA (cytidine1920-2'-O)/16S rRNA (cytidine1409-2'-O)-methyltransferase
MKKRIDILLVEKGLCPSREKARARIIAGDIFAGSARVKTPSEKFEEDARIEVKGGGCPYVSRGGYKLEKALDRFGIDLAGRVCVDIGASTGGFTDCMLQNGAARVYSVDVGYGQFDWKLRNDPRVVLRERTNARYLDPVPEPVDFISVDVSFISLRLIFPAAVRISGGIMRMVALIKPQFEAGKEKVGKKGVVKEKDTHYGVIKNVRAFGEEQGLYMNDLDYSPIKGPNGNIEFLGLFSKDGENTVGDDRVETVVDEAHFSL